MEIIKEVCITPEKSTTVIIIRSDCYCSSYEHVEMLRDELRKDFDSPIQNSSIKIVIYGGRRYKGTLGIEATLPHLREIPDKYIRVKSLEYVL